MKQSTAFFKSMSPINNLISFYYHLGLKLAVKVTTLTICMYLLNLIMPQFSSQRSLMIKWPHQTSYLHKSIPCPSISYDALDVICHYSSAHLRYNKSLSLLEYAAGEEGEAERVRAGWGLGEGFVMNQADILTTFSPLFSKTTEEILLLNFFSRSKHQSTCI